MRIFLDANILFSAALPQSRVFRLIHIAKHHVTLLTNVYASEEARRNLASKKESALPAFEKLLLECERVGATLTNLPVKLTDKDTPILGGAIAGDATHLLTGDRRDFGAFWGETLQGVKIVSPQMLAEEMIKKGWLQKKKQ